MRISNKFRLRFSFFFPLYFPGKSARMQQNAKFVDFAQMFQCLFPALRFNDLCNF